MADKLKYPKAANLPTEEIERRRHNIKMVVNARELIRNGLFSGAEAKTILDIEEWLGKVMDENDFVS